MKAASRKQMIAANSRAFACTHMYIRWNVEDLKSFGILPLSCDDSEMFSMDDAVDSVSISCMNVFSTIVRS